jgi:hypothetical protein
MKSVFSEMKLQAMKQFNELVFCLVPDAINEVIFHNLRSWANNYKLRFQVEL